MAKRDEFVLSDRKELRETVARLRSCRGAQGNDPEKSAALEHQIRRLLRDAREAERIL